MQSQRPLLAELEAMSGLDARDRARAGAAVRPDGDGDGRHARTGARPSTCCRWPRP
ncbi:hypothetical protein LP419_07510 [Massilia sp. H-1]|nr:hypothetical protein LP419_07510 [Massilia sp. H-1]